MGRSTGWMNLEYKKKNFFITKITLKTGKMFLLVKKKKYQEESQIKMKNINIIKRREKSRDIFWQQNAKQKGREVAWRREKWRKI